MGRLPNTFHYGRWQLGWVCVLGLNLIIPLMFGLGFAQDDARWGMWLAIGCIWLAGHFYCKRGRVNAYSLVVGGAFFALGQLIPVLQIVAGMIGLSVARGLNLTNLPSDTKPLPSTSSFFGGFLATTITAFLLIPIAYSIGRLAYRVEELKKPLPDLREL